MFITPMTTEKATRKNGSRKVIEYDPLTHTDKVRIYGYCTPNLESRKEKPTNTDTVKAILNQTTTLNLNVYEIAFNGASINNLFKQSVIPEINRLILHQPVTIRIGNCHRQRKQFIFITCKHGQRKINIRLIKQREKKPLTLKGFKPDKRFNYKLTFKCTLCNNHQTMNIKNHGKKRSNPICTKHYDPSNPFNHVKPIQSMLLTKITKIKPKTSTKPVYPRIIYEVL